MVDQELLQREKIEQFKRDARSVYAWKLMLKEIEEQLSWVAEEMQGVSSPNLTDPVVNRGIPASKGTRFYGLMEEEDRLVRRQKELINKLREVSCSLDRIRSEEDRAMIKRLYIDRVPPDEVAEAYHYERRALYKRIDRILRGLMKEGH